MKKVLMVLAFTSMLLFSACGKEKESIPEENTPVQQNQESAQRPAESVSPIGEDADKTSEDITPEGESTGIISDSAASSKTEVPADPSAKPEVKAGKQTGTSQEPGTQPSADQKVTSQPNTTAAGTTNSAEYGIVAKSDNVVSSTEKQEILNTLDGEINKLLGNIDGLDGVTEADLSTN